jgi:hypothetical protein
MLTIHQEKNKFRCRLAAGAARIAEFDQKSILLSILFKFPIVLPLPLRALFLARSAAQILRVDTMLFSNLRGGRPNPSTFISRTCITLCLRPGSRFNVRGMSPPK